jgi:hypothetical protein
MDLLPCQSFACQQFGETTLGRAALVCSSHIALREITLIPRPRIPQFMPGWEACTKVWSAWLESEDGRKLREAEDAEKRDREFVNSIADTLR